MRNLLRVTSFIFFLLALVYAYLAWTNNKPVTAPHQAQLQTTLENSIHWLEKNREKILVESNPMLWYMIQQAADVSGDKRLQQLFAGYEQRYLDKRGNNPWRPLFYPGTWVAVRFEDIASFPYYNWHFIYATLCDRELGQIPEIAAQNDPAFCDLHRLRPACVTHQLMGIRLLQQSKCGDPAQLNDTVLQLQQRISRQLLLDPRVVDVYMQRVLMLMESGADELVKPIWIRNLVDAQRADGGWSPFAPLVPVGVGRYFGYGQKFFAIRQPRSSFHMTAQGVLLFSLLTSR